MAYKSSRTGTHSRLDPNPESSILPLDQLAATIMSDTVYPKKYAHGFCFAVLCCGYTLTDFPISTRLTSLALWQSNDCPSAGKATLMNMDKYFMWNHYERLHNHNKAKHNKTVCIFLGIYCTYRVMSLHIHTTGSIKMAHEITAYQWDMWYHIRFELTLVLCRCDIFSLIIFLMHQKASSHR